MFVLLGDSVDDSAPGATPKTVNATDSQKIRNTQNGTIDPSFGAIGYNTRADLDGNGTINATESLYVRDQQNATIIPL